MASSHYPDLKSKENGWYDLFSRGARDWLRHNEKVRDTVRTRLPELIAGPDVITRPDNRTVRVPVRFLEHHRFRLRRSDKQKGVGQGRKGQVSPGDVLRPESGQGTDNGAGTGEGELQFVLELKVDDIVDWLWEELELPNLKPKRGEAIVDEHLVREGWDRRGVRSRLDRRRTMKEAIKRRSMQERAPDFANEDLRFRQLAKRQQPATSAVVFFALDVSSSMGPENRRVAKTFFFWALQGLRRQYARIETIFIAHTSSAWEFSEDEFFQVAAEGGTEASSAFGLALDIFKQRYDAGRFNGYLFYASDGDNFIADRTAATEALVELGSILNFIGYVEIGTQHKQALDTETGHLLATLAYEDLPVGSYAVNGHEDIWPAIRSMFRQQADKEVL
jgi:sporulation protein YhbH